MKMTYRVAFVVFALGEAGMASLFAWLVIGAGRLRLRWSSMSRRGRDLILALWCCMDRVGRDRIGWIGLLLR